MADIVFHELIVDINQLKKRQSPRGTTPKGAPGFNPDNAVGAGVRLVAKALIVVQEWGDSRNKKAFLEGEDFLKRLSGYLKSDAGVLVEVQSDQWAIPDPAGNQLKMFRTAVICGSGANPEDVLFRYLNSDRLAAAPAKDWKRINSYVWATIKK